MYCAGFCFLCQNDTMGDCSVCHFWSCLLIAFIAVILKWNEIINKCPCHPRPPQNAITDNPMVMQFFDLNPPDNPAQQESEL